MSGRMKIAWKLGLAAVPLVMVVAVVGSGCIPGPGPLGTILVTVTSPGPGTVATPLNLSGSAGGGIGAYTYAWTQTGGPTGTFASTNLASTTFTPKAGGIHKFTLTVVDSLGASGSATAQSAVGDIEFFVASATVPGNPAVVQSTSRTGPASFLARARVFDPEFVNDQNTEMQVHYEIISFPNSASSSLISLERSFDTIGNQGQGTDNLSGALDGAVGVTIRANPEASYKVMTNLASTSTAVGELVPGDYVFRATVTNPSGIQRYRNLTVTLLLQSAGGDVGIGGQYMATTQGPTAVAVKELPTGSPGRVTDKVMDPNKTAAMTVSVFPSSTTSYRFYLLDNNSVAHPEYVVASPNAPVAYSASPTDVSLTIGASGGIPYGTYTLWMESFDQLGNLSNTEILVNRGTSSTDPVMNVPVRFHVTKDFYAQSSINAEQIGEVSNDVDAGISYQGWGGAPTGAYTSVSALADVNLDGALDILTLTSSGFSVRWAGFRSGSESALRHPVNNGNFGGIVGTANFILVSLPAPTQLAVGDLNGDGLPDVAVTATSGALSFIKIFFHTGDGSAPYSGAADQTLMILPPEYDRRTLTTTTNVLSTGSFVPEPARNLFGRQIAIADATGDGTSDLIVTDPAFNTVRVLYAPSPDPNGWADPNLADPNFAAPPAADTLYAGNEGRVYVFAGGTSGELKPGRPQIITSLITERELITPLDVSIPTPNNPVLSTSWAEASAMYTAAYNGNLFDQIGYSLATGTGVFAVGSPIAVGDPNTSTLQGALQIVNPVTDNDTVTFLVGQPGVTPSTVFRRYVFDVDGSFDPLDPNCNSFVRVDVSANPTSPEYAITQLIAAINGDTDTGRLMTAARDPARAERVNYLYRFGAKDGNARAVVVGLTLGATMTDPQNAIAATITQNADGIVYRVATATPSGTLTDGIAGTANTNMGLGSNLALGKINDASATTTDDLVISALDSGDPNGVPGDGAVFISYDGDPNLTRITGIGANSLGTGGWGGTDLPATGVGSTIGAADVNGDNLAEVFITEPGFDRIYMIKGAAGKPSAPDLTLIGVVFNIDLSSTGTFLFGDITGDTQTDWVFLNPTLNIGFCGFAR